MFFYYSRGGVSLVFTKQVKPYFVVDHSASVTHNSAGEKNKGNTAV